MKRLPPGFKSYPINQSSMPSQHGAQPWQTGQPYNPVNQPDIRRPYKTRLAPDMVAGEPSQNEPLGVQIPREIASVQHIFDSRPVQGYDIFFTDKFFDNGIIFRPELGGYRVPDGFNLFLRKITVSGWPNTGDVDNAVLTLLGPTTVTVHDVVQMSMLVDGAATPLWTSVHDMANQPPIGPLNGVPLPDFGFCDTEFDCFIIVPGGSIVTAAFINPGAVAGMTPWKVIVHYYGNLLLDTGRTLSNEAGNDRPIPVTIAGEIP